MSAEQQLLDVLSVLSSNKKKEKLGALENLICLLSQGSLVKILNRNSLTQESGVNWDIVFTRVHNAVLNLIDETNAKSRQMCEKHVEIILDVLVNIVQKSVHHQCLLINSNLIASSVLAVFESENRTRCVGSAYFNMLHKHVLAQRENWQMLKDEYWTGIKNLCKTYYNSPPKGIQGTLFLEMLINVIRCSTKKCQISHNFLDLFSFLRDIYVSYKKSGSNFEITLLRLTITLCLQLAVEFRYKVCEFMENVFDVIKSFHETKNPEKNVVVYHFLMTTLSIHNPNGLWGDKTCYACDIQKWKAQIREIFQLCHNEVKLFLKGPNKLEMDIDFLDLFVDVTYLMWESGLENVPESHESELRFDEPGPSKKRKCSFDTVGSPLRTKQIKLEGGVKSLLKNLNSSDCWFWLKFLELLLHKHPFSLKNDYCDFVKFLCHLICEKKDVENTKIAISCLGSLFELENSLPEDEKAEDLGDVWKKISAETTRSLCQEAHTESHALIRALITHSKFGDPEPLLKLYCEGTLPPDLENFKTLSTICQRCILPEMLSDKNFRNKENCEKVRVKLLSWLFQNDKTFPCKDLAKLIIALIVKRFEEDIETSVPNDQTLLSHNNINDFCQLITNSYLTVAFKGLSFVTDARPPESNLQIRIESGMKNKLFEVLIAQYESRVSVLKNETPGVANLTNGVWFCELLCHLISALENTNETNGKEFLMRMLQDSLYLCSSRSLTILKTNLCDLSSFSKLYSGSFHVNIQRKIREPEFIDLNFLQAVFQLFNDVLQNEGLTTADDGAIPDSRFSQLIKNPKSVLHFQRLSGREKLIVHAAEMMCHYITLPGSECNQYQIMLSRKIIDVLTSEEFDCCAPVNTQLVLSVLFIFTKHEGITGSVLNDSLSLLQRLCLSKLPDFEVVLSGVQILKDFMHLVKKSPDAKIKSKYRKIFQDFRTSIAVKKNCGLKTTLKFIECLAEMSRMDLDESWELADGSRCSVFEDLIRFLNHPYNEVRLAAAQHVGLLFVHENNRRKSTVEWQEKMFKKLFDVLKNVDGFKKGKGCVVEFHDRVVSSTTLISWASVICLSSYWRKKALFYLIYTSFLRKFKPGDVQDIMALICKELHFQTVENYISSNFSYLCHKWLKKKLPIEDFPYRLLSYETVKDFLGDRFPDIAVVHAELGHLDDIKTLSAKINKPLGEILQRCHPRLLAFILPSLSENAKCETMKKAQKLKHLLDKEVGSKVAMQWLTQSLDKIIYEMIRNMHDPSYLLTLCEFSGNLKDDKNLRYGTSQVEETLESLGTVGDKPLLGKIALEMPWMIENIFRRLLKTIVRALVPEEKVFALYKYVFFVEAMGKATQKGAMYRRINAFIIRDVVYALVAVLRHNDHKVITNLACECFGKLADCYVKEFSGLLGEFLPAITTALTPAVKAGDKRAVEVLGFLICDNYPKLEPQIALLDFFPPENAFAGINKQIEKTKAQGNLKNSIKHFISAGRSKNSGCRIEGLKNLRGKLSKEKTELREMYGALKLLRGFSEDCKDSLLHQLICMLVELTSDGDITVRTEAAKCLGELGPSDLTTLVLRPENNFTTSATNVSTIHKLLQTAVSSLFDLSISDDYEVKKASAKCLHAVLRTKQGRELLQEGTKTSEYVDYLTPFASKPGGQLHLGINKKIFFEKLTRESLWRPTTHEKWVVDLLTGLLESLDGSREVIDSFLKLIRVNWQFAESLLPVTLDFVLSLNEGNVNEIINSNISAFFEENFHHEDKSLIRVDKTSVRCFLNIIDYVRMERSCGGLHESFGLNYLHVAKAALYCSAFFTSVFYAELWFEDKRESHQNVDINVICESFPEEGYALAGILRECHFKIGNTDGMHGCGYMHILHPAAEVQHYEHLKNWNLSLLHHDIQLAQGKREFETGLLHSLERLGMFYTLSSLIKRSETPELAVVQYKTAARLLDWSQLEDSTYRTNVECFDKSFYFALKAFHDEDTATFQNEIQRARKNVLTELAQCSLESSKNLYHPISELQCLKELEDFAASSGKSDLESLFEKWGKQDGINCGEFKLIESILTNRTILIRDALERAEDDEMKECLQRMLCRVYYKLTAAARKEKKYETAIRTLSYFRNIDQPPKDLNEKMEIEKARVLWDRGDRDIGRFLLSHFLKKQTGDELKSKGLRIYGDWMAETKAENSREIIENYYMKSIERCSKSQTRIHSYYSLAKFADSIYEQLDEYLSSPLFEIKQNLFNTQQDLASELRQELGWNQNIEKKMAYMIASKQSAIDENEIKNCRAERDTYLTAAIKYYLLSLKEGENYNLVVFRIISLWLSNAGNADVIQQLQKLLHHIPTYKFLCLLPQLVPRMADVCLISDLIEKILQDHPHHTLPLLFALSNSYEDLKYSGSKTTGINPRVLAAKSILGKFATDRKLETLITQMRRFSGALIEFANYNPPSPDRSRSVMKFAEHLEIKHIGRLSSVWVPSLQIPHNKHCRYDDVIGVHGFEERYYLVGGINVPKRVTCIGTDGIGRPLLVKGKDDLRQDAVMQQVFTIMNSLLYQNSETSKRKLVIRTYKVVPLSQRSGVIEWCENTQPLSLYLTGSDGKSGAHQRFYPNDTSAYDCRTIIRQTFAQSQVTNEEKLKVFLNVCKQIHPVFHYFFIEKFPAAGVWFERRLAYIHSVATSSMIGYILGIGDRHVYNILIDNTTAEVIHIDLGIAFEQGKTLRIPETVPFRLTRDIVDGMGLSGVEGDFRISCIKTMEVLRENQDTILTLLEVLLYDPLYTWTITPEKAYSIQNHTEASSSTTEKSSPDVETNKMAERALIRLKQKLQGTETGFGATNVEGQVSYLIQQARDPNNLCRLFHGWQAYL